LNFEGKKIWYSLVGWATLFCPPHFKVKGGLTVKLFADPTRLDKERSD